MHPVLKRIKIDFLDNSHTEEKILVSLLSENVEQRPIGPKECGMKA